MTDLKEITCVIVNWIAVNQNRAYGQGPVKIITDRLTP